MGQQRYRYWLGREVARLAPKAIKTVDRVMDGKNAVAAVRAAEGVLDRSGLHADDMRHLIKLEADELIVHIDLGD